MKRYTWLILLSSACIKGGADNPEPFAVWSGWNHTWALLAHRISVIQVKADDGTQAQSGILGGDWSTGESWSDDVNYRIHQQVVSSHWLMAEHGETVLNLSPDGQPLSLPSPTDIDADLVVLRGFQITTDVEQGDDYPEDYDPALGYTSRGFGMSVALNDDGDVVVFGDVRWGPRDRDDMNAAIPHAASELTVWWTAISGVDEADSFDFVAQQDLAHDPPNSPQAGMSQPLPWTGHGVAGLTGFDFTLDDTDGGSGGDYLRSFGVEIPPMSDGDAPSEISGEVLTTSVIELGTMSMGVQAQAVWIPLDPASTRIEGATLEGNHGIGMHTVPVETED
jgi:hypothetical protein